MRDSGVRYAPARLQAGVRGTPCKACQAGTGCALRLPGILARGGAATSQRNSPGHHEQMPTQQSQLPTRCSCLARHMMYLGPHVKGGQACGPVASEHAWPAVSITQGHNSRRAVKTQLRKYASIDKFILQPSHPILTLRCANVLCHP